jgi:hypothetical protein
MSVLRLVGKGGEPEPMRKIVNFTFLWGCKPGFGIDQDSKFSQDEIDLFRENSDVKYNYIDIPKVYS